MFFPLALFAAGVLTPLVATTVLTVGLMTTASTLTRTATPRRKPVRHTDRPPEVPILNELARLHDELKLDVSQDTLWCKAEKADWCNMSHVQAGLRKQRDEIAALLAEPGVDLRTVAKQLDDFQSEGHQQCAANRERWLSVYDALDANQKEQVRVFFRNKMEQAGQADAARSPA